MPDPPHATNLQTPSATCHPAQSQAAQGGPLRCHGMGVRRGMTSDRSDDPYDGGDQLGFDELDETSGGTTLDDQRITEEFSLVPAAGGGFGAWTTALARKLDRLLELGAHCVIVDCDDPCCYVQLLATPAGTIAEAVSNVYLVDWGAELDPDQETALGTLGWVEPAPPCEGDTCSSEDHGHNWTTEFPDPTSTRTIARLLAETLVGVYGVTETDLLTVKIFPAFWRDWRWDDERGLVHVDP